MVNKEININNVISIRLSQGSFMGEQLDYEYKFDDLKINQYIFDEIRIQNWKPEYKQKDVIILDGDEWEVIITLKNGKEITKYCHEAYPTTFKKIRKLFETLSLKIYWIKLFNTFWQIYDQLN